MMICSIECDKKTKALLFLIQRRMECKFKGRIELNFDGGGGHPKVVEHSAKSSDDLLRDYEKQLTRDSR
jgi:hypothetical protein